jgi:hydrogenase nickel incorporation protein HypA/HybF
MHELSIANSILDIVGEYVPVDRRAAVKAVHVRVGALSGVVAESLEFSFAAITAGTPLQNAALVIDRVPVRIRCTSCNHEFETDSPFFLCPKCDGSETIMLTGNELHVVEIELEDQPAESS